MKYVILLICMTTGVSCTVIQTKNPSGQRNTYASFAGDAYDLDIEPSGKIHAARIDNSTGAKNLGDDVTAGIGIIQGAKTLRNLTDKTTGATTHLSDNATKETLGAQKAATAAKQIDADKAVKLSQPTQ